MPSTPKLGIILPEGEGDLDGRTPRWSDYVAMARLTEEAGFDSLWFVDHLIYRNDASGRPPAGGLGVLVGPGRACRRDQPGRAGFPGDGHVLPQPGAAGQDGRHRRRDQRRPA